MNNRNKRRRKIMPPRRRTPVGSPPGTLVADPASARTAMTVFSYDKDTLKEMPLASAEAFGKPDMRRAVTWLNIDGLADVEEIRRIGAHFELHGLALEDVINVHQRPKVEEFPDHLFIVTRMLRLEDIEDSGASEQVSLFLTDGVVITFQERPGDLFDPIRERIRHGSGRIREQGADYLAYALLDAVTDGYFPVLEAVGEKLAGLEDKVIAEPGAMAIGEIHDMKRVLLHLRRDIWPQRELFNTLIRTENALVSRDTKIYLRDCYDHAIQLMDVVETYREIASSLVDIYLSSLSNNLNHAMKVLTVIATIFMPLGFIASLYGMNFDRSSPWNMPELGWHFGYPIVLFAMGVAVAGMIFYFRRSGLLGGPGRK